MMTMAPQGVLAENGERDYEEFPSDSNSSRTDFLQQYLYEPILLYVWRRLSVHLVWDGLPTHLICWPKLEFILFYLLNTLSFLFSGAAVYIQIYDGIVKRKLGDLSKKIFGLSKTVTAFIFTQGCALVVQELFVPVTIAISAVSK